MIQQLFLLVLYSQFLGVSFMDLDPFFSGWDPDIWPIWIQTQEKVRSGSGQMDPDQKLFVWQAPESITTASRYSNVRRSCAV